MADILMFDWTLPNAIRRAMEEKHLPDPGLSVPIPDLPMKVYLTAPPPTYKMLNDDPLLLQMCSDSCQDAFYASLKTIIPRLKAFDQAVEHAQDDFFKYVDLRSQMIQQVKLDIDAAGRQALAGMSMRWQQMQAREKEYKKYRLDVGVKIVKGAVGLAGAAGGLAAAVPTGGATLALAIIGAYRAVMDGGKTLWECIQDADRCQKTVEKELRSLQATYAKSHSRGVVREVAASTVNAVVKLPFDLTNIKTLEDTNTLWGGKLTHLDFLAHELAKDLNGLLEKTEQLQAALLSNPDSKKKVASLEAFQKDIQLLLDKGFFIVSMGRRVQITQSWQEAEKGLARQEKVTAAIKDLKAGRSGGVDWFDQIIAFAADAALSAANYGVSPPSFTSGTSAISQAQSGIGIAMDGLTNLKAVYDIAAEHSEKVKETEEKVKESLKEKVLGRSPVVGPPVPPKPQGWKSAVPSRVLPKT